MQNEGQAFSLQGVRSFVHCLKVASAEKYLVQSPVEKNAATPDHFHADELFQRCSCADLKSELLRHAEELFHRCSCSDLKSGLLTSADGPEQHPLFRNLI